MSEAWTMFGPAVRGRKCGSCTQCCTALPVELVPGHFKPANVACEHLCSKGCGIYAKRPDPCSYWNCQWLISEDTAGLKRPDISGVIIDSAIDQILADGQQVDVIQLWCDPKRPLAYRAPEVLAYLSAMYDKHGLVALVRYANDICFTFLPPQVCADGEWHEVRGEMVGEGEVQRRLIAAGDFKSPMVSASAT